MKNIRMILSACVVLSIVGSALAFTAKPFGTGSVYCTNNTTSCSDLRNFKVDENGTVLDVCNGGQEYIFDGAACIPTAPAAKFKAVPAGK
ncbi:MAG: hypothetical protein ABI675_02790 [Chitinophagaceae bacterium]